jgi:hypothetical protein
VTRESHHFMQPSLRSCQKAWSRACRSMPGLLFARGLHVPTADFMGLHVWQYSCAGLAVYPQPCRQMGIMCAGGLGALYKSAGHRCAFRCRSPLTSYTGNPPSPLRHPGWCPAAFRTSRSSRGSLVICELSAQWLE